MRRVLCLIGVLLALPAQAEARGLTVDDGWHYARAYVRQDVRDGFAARGWVTTCRQRSRWLVACNATYANVPVGPGACPVGYTCPRAYPRLTDKLYVRRRGGRVAVESRLFG